MAEKIKDCPFCGSDDLVPSFHALEKDEALVCVACERCDCEGPTIKFVKSDPDRRAALSMAHAAWNRRK